jgi:hypothetical protein
MLGFRAASVAETRVLGIPSLGGLEVLEVLPHLVPYVFAVALRYGSPERGENSQTDPGINLRNLQTSTPLVFREHVALGLRPATAPLRPANKLLLPLAGSAYTRGRALPICQLEVAMPQHPPMTAEQKQLAIQLRSDGMSYLKIAAKIRVSETTAFKFLKSLLNPPAPKPEKKPTRKASKTTRKASPLPPHEFHGSCPIHRRAVVSFEMRNAPQLTHKQLQFEFERAWKNTARLSH